VPHSPQRWFDWVVIALLVVFVGCIHIWNLDSVPRGFSADETAIGNSALLVAQTGYDEHHHFLPVYFLSTGDYKAPVYIYAVAAGFALFGPSPLALRLTSFAFFAAFAVGFILLVRKLCGARRLTMPYAVGCVGLLPWFFTLSRIAFEVISQLATTTIALLFIRKIFSTELKRPILTCGVAGLVTALAMYSYPTGRLLIPILVASTLLLYVRRSTWPRGFWFLAGILAGLGPYALFSYLNPGAMTARFRTISYVFDPSLTVSGKVLRFLHNFAAYFSPRFLLIAGDTNERHATGLGGEVYWIVFALSIVGLWSIATQTRLRNDRFIRLLVLNSIAAPVAASLTSEGTPHSLRSVLLGLYIALFSCLGFQALLEMRQNAARRILIAATGLMLTYESATYLYDYFTRYAERSQYAFAGNGLAEAFRSAVERNPASIVVSTSTARSNVEFFRRVEGIPSSRMTIAKPEPTSNTCVIFWPSDDRMVHASPLQFEELGKPRAIVRLRCYK
jgi:4-amino-4-deoxy-L-arabinose transferase-like glycosyltransferase